jgi:hypothetical protein
MQSTQKKSSAAALIDSFRFQPSSLCKRPAPSTPPHSMPSDFASFQYDDSEYINGILWHWSPVPSNNCFSEAVNRLVRQKLKDLVSAHLPDQIIHDSPGSMIKLAESLSLCRAIERHDN